MYLYPSATELLKELTINALSKVWFKSEKSKSVNSLFAI